MPGRVWPRPAGFDETPAFIPNGVYGAKEKTAHDSLCNIELDLHPTLGEVGPILIPCERKWSSNAFNSPALLSEYAP